MNSIKSLVQKNPKQCVRKLQSRGARGNALRQDHARRGPSQGRGVGVDGDVDGEEEGLG